MVITLVFPIAGVSIEQGGHQGAGVTAEGRGCRSENRGHGSSPAMFQVHGEPETGDSELAVPEAARLPMNSREHVNFMVWG